MDTILVVNAGSSSVKFQVFSVEGEGKLQRQIKGQMDGIGSRPRLRASGANGDSLADRAYPIESVPDVPAALATAGDWLRNELRISPMAVGHRVVHGGPNYDRPVLIDHGVVARLEQLSCRWPRCISRIIWRRSAPCWPIFRIFRRWPVSTPRFTARMKRSQTTMRFRISFTPRAFGVTDFTVSHTNMSPRPCRKSRPISPTGRVIVAHLGSGASMCALKQGRSAESTMGFTALDGLPMGTRPGQIDPGVVLYLIAEKGMSASDVQNFLYRDCGLKGLSGISNDMRELEASEDPQSETGDRLFRLSDRPQRRHACGRVAGSRRVRLYRRHRRKLGAYPGADRRAAGLAWCDARSGRKCPSCAADIPLRQPYSGLCHTDRRGTDDRAAHIVAAVEPAIASARHERVS